MTLKHLFQVSLAIGAIFAGYRIGNDLQVRLGIRAKIASITGSVGL